MGGNLGNFPSNLSISSQKSHLSLFFLKLLDHLMPNTTLRNTVMGLKKTKRNGTD